MRDLQYQLKQLCTRNKDGAMATQVNRARLLALVAEQLWHLGYRTLQVTGLRRRHVNRLIALWTEQGLDPGTMKNRLSAVRWWAQKIGHGHMLPRANNVLGIAKRPGVSAVSRAITVSPEQLLAIRDPYVRLSLELQRVFGLRREEAIKMQPALADHDHVLVLKGSWTKGGKPRTLPICTREQRVLLDRAHRLAREGSLIPPDRSYKNQLEVYKYEMQRIGVYKPHGLRHAYAQDRYAALSGLQAPAAGGPQELTTAERAADHAARLAVSKELGHERKHITSAYLGAIKPRPRQAKEADHATQEKGPNARPE